MFLTISHWRMSFCLNTHREKYALRTCGVDKKNDVIFLFCRDVKGHHNVFYRSMILMLVNYSRSYNLRNPPQIYSRSNPNIFFCQSCPLTPLLSCSTVFDRVSYSPHPWHFAICAQCTPLTFRAYPRFVLFCLAGVGAVTGCRQCCWND